MTTKYEELESAPVAVPRGRRALVRKLIREPLVHFLVAGVVLFALNAWLSRHERVWASHHVKLTSNEIQRLREMWAVQWGRLPDPKETDQIVSDYIREEVLYREALALGLDQGDTIVRRRLAMKMDFLLSDQAAQLHPSEADLRQFYAAHRAKYQDPARLSFTHIFFSHDRRKSPEQEARELLPKLANSSAAAENRGDRFPYASEYISKDEDQINRDFGPGFAQKIFQSPIGVWLGPFESGFGYHLVFVSIRTAPVAIDFANVRDQVLKDYVEELRRNEHEKAYQAVRHRYSIEVEK